METAFDNLKLFLSLRHSIMLEGGPNFPLADQTSPSPNSVLKHITGPWITFNDRS